MMDPYAPQTRLTRELNYLAQKIRPQYGFNGAEPSIEGPREISETCWEGRVVVPAFAGHRVAYIIRLERDGEAAGAPWVLRQSQERV